MAINQFPPRFRRGTQPLPAVASGTVVGGTFVKVAGDKDADGSYQYAHCGLGDRADGVAEYDADASLGNRFAVTPKPSVARVQPGANITAGDEIISDANGKAVPKGAEVAAKLDTGVVGSNNAITWTAKKPGVGGNSISVTIVDPGGTSATLSVDVAENGLDITVNLGRASSAINSTAQNVMDAIEANGQAADLVTVANKSTSNGTGLMAAVSKTNLAGGTGSDDTGGHVNGIAQHDALSSDRFVEVALV